VNIATMADISEYMTTDEAAKVLGYSPEYVRRMLRKGKLPSEKMGRLWLIPRDAVEEYKEAVKGLERHDPRRSLDF